MWRSKILDRYYQIDIKFIYLNSQSRVLSEYSSWKLKWKYQIEQINKKFCVKIVFKFFIYFKNFEFKFCVNIWMIFELYMWGINSKSLGKVKEIDYKFFCIVGR